MSGLISDMV